MDAHGTPPDEAGSLYRDDVTGFNVEAGQVVVVAIILQCAHLHRCRGICKTRGERLGADEQRPLVHGWRDSCSTVQIKVVLIFIIPKGQFVVVQSAASTQERCADGKDHSECWLPT